MLEVFKIVRGVEDVKDDIFFTIIDKNLIHTTRGHTYKLFKRRFNKDSAKFSFGHRIVSTWNALPKEIVQAESMLTFKMKLDHYMIKVLGLH